MATDLWTVDRTGDQLATDNAISTEAARESMVDAATDLSLVEVKVLFGSRCSITCSRTGWVLLTNANPVDALLAASLSGWTEDSGGQTKTKH